MELQRPAAAALANLCSEVGLAERLIEVGGMQALTALSESQDRQVQARFCVVCPLLQCSGGVGNHISTNARCSKL